MRRARRRTSALVALAWLATACASPEGSAPRPGSEATVPATTPATVPATSPEPEPEPAATFTVEVVAQGLRAPWDVAFDPDGAAYFSERDTGRVLRIDGTGGVDEAARLDVDPAGEGGLLGLATAPDGTGTLYAYLTTASDNRVVRFRPGEPPRPVITGIPKARIHDGGRIEFGPDGRLYVGTGDAGQPELAQDPTSLAGKILRLEPDGSIPGDNPFAGSPVLSLGHRNVQGLAWDGRGRLWAGELGPDRDDELNRIQPGGNYGWPQATGGSGGGGFRPAAAVRQPAEASWSGLAFVDGDAVPAWGDSLVAAGLRGERLWRFPVAPDGGLGPGEALLVGEHGRLRHAEWAPDGTLWILTSNRDGRGSPRPGDDRVLRLRW